MSESSCRKLVAENPAEGGGERIGGFRGLKMHVKGEVRKRDGKRDEVLACGRMGEQADDVWGVHHQLQDGLG